MGALRWLLALALWLPVAPDEVFSMELEKDGGILRLEVPKTSDAAAVGDAVRAFIAAHDLVEGMGCDDAACIQDVLEAAVNEGLAGATDTAEDAGEAAVVELEHDGATLALRAPRAGVPAAGTRSARAADRKRSPRYVLIAALSKSVTSPATTSDGTLFGKPGFARDSALWGFAGTCS